MNNLFHLAFPVKNLEESRAFSALVVESIREPVILLDERLRIVSVNRAFTNVFHIAQDFAAAGDLRKTEGRLQPRIAARF